MFLLTTFQSFHIKFPPKFYSIIKCNITVSIENLFFEYFSTFARVCWDDWKFLIWNLPQIICRNVAAQWGKGGGSTLSTNFVCFATLWWNSRFFRYILAKLEVISSSYWRNSLYISPSFDGIRGCFKFVWQNLVILWFLTKFCGGFRLFFVIYFNIYYFLIFWRNLWVFSPF